MAHWDEERDAKRVQKMRELRHTPEGNRLIDLYEDTGDLIYWNAFLDQLKRAT